jgi:hypothetical protein
VAFANGGKPIYSSRADDLEFRDSIDEFVVKLAERIDRLQDADSRGDLKEVADLGAALAADSRHLGFESLALACEVVHACACEENGVATHRELVALTEISHRIRLGHRGAV